MTWSCIAVKKPSVSTNKSAFVRHLFYIIIIIIIIIITIIIIIITTILINIRLR